MVNRIWPTVMVGKADVSSVSASACHIGGPNSVSPGQILLVYGTTTFVVSCYFANENKRSKIAWKIGAVKPQSQQIGFNQRGIRISFNHFNQLETELPPQVQRYRVSVRHFRFDVHES